MLWLHNGMLNALSLFRILEKVYHLLQLRKLLRTSWQMMFRLQIRNVSFITQLRYSHQSRTMRQPTNFNMKNQRSILSAHVTAE
jgi:hypothetical protein